MKKISILIATILSATILFGAVIPASAASAEVNIEVKATSMDEVSVTVPSVIPIIFNADGTNTVPTNWEIENVSQIAGIHLSQIDMDGGPYGWTLLPDSVNIKEQSVDKKAIQFFVGKEGNLKLVQPSEETEHYVGSVTYEANEISIPSGQSQVLTFAVNRGAFTQDMAAAKAFEMMLTFEFN